MQWGLRKITSSCFRYILASQSDDLPWHAMSASICRFQGDLPGVFSVLQVISLDLGMSVNAGGPTREQTLRTLRMVKNPDNFD